MFKKKIYWPNFYYQDLGCHASSFAFMLLNFVFMLLKSNHLQNLVTPKETLLNETTPENINLC